MIPPNHREFLKGLFVWPTASVVNCRPEFLQDINLEVRGGCKRKSQSMADVIWKAMMNHCIFFGHPIFTQTHCVDWDVVCWVLFTDHAVKWWRSDRGPHFICLRFCRGVTSLPSPLIIGGSFQLSREEGIAGNWIFKGTTYLFIFAFKHPKWARYSVWATFSLPSQNSWPQISFLCNTKH